MMKLEETNDTVPAFYMRMKDSECFDNISLFIVDVIVSKHNTL